MVAGVLLQWLQVTAAMAALLQWLQMRVHLEFSDELGSGACSPGDVTRRCVRAVPGGEVSKRLCVAPIQFRRRAFLISARRILWRSRGPRD